MKSITRAFSALAIVGTVLAASSAFAATPFDIATKAHRGQIDGIAGYQTLELDISSGQVTGEDILEAAGADVNSRDADLVERFLRSNEGRD